MYQKEKILKLIKRSAMMYVYITKCSAGQKHGHELFVRCERCAKRGVAGMEAICNGKNLLAATAASVHATV